jgi:hypothetical protein
MRPMQIKHTQKTMCENQQEKQETIQGRKMEMQELRWIRRGK